MQKPDPSTQRGERTDGWGYADTQFSLQNNVVLLEGNRYETSGKRIPALLEWASQKLGQPLSLQSAFASTGATPVDPPKAVPELLAALEQAGIGYSQDDDARRRHSHGHALEEVYAIRFGRIERAPDVVVYPESEAQVQAVVQLALAHKVVLVPFGGGSNVSHALKIPNTESRAVVSVDMRRMNRILTLDKENRIAHIEAGIYGQDLQAALEQQGYTLGHEPDSIEFSTLGGWIATRSSGMKKNRYGNIEDLVLDVRLVTANGMISGSAAMPRESMGIDPRVLALGSEGNLGIICSAWVKVFPLPEVQKFDSVLFHDFASGLEFMRDLSAHPPYPASARLLDNFQFQFGQALKPESEGWKKVKSQLERRLVTGVLGFKPDKMCAFTLLYEGSREDVRLQQARVAQLAKKHRGFRAGGENGKRGYQLTFAIAYIRDFLMRFGIMAESFETSVPWSKLAGMCEAVRECIFSEHQKLGLPGNPIISWRVTQIYHSGAAVYFYLGTLANGVENPADAFAKLEHAARATILAHGGSISHHHGVGKLRADFVGQVKTETGQAALGAAKRQLDPDNVFAIANQGF
ncbi:MAG: FAD-binding oxidoreductase [Deinococcales bacterium]